VPQTRERIYIVGFRDEANKTEQDKKCTKDIHNCIEQEKVDDYYYYNPDSQYYEMFNKEIKKRDTVYQLRRVYVRENKSNVCPTLTANMGTGGHNVPLIRDDYGIRKLTPLECARFQGIPHDYVLPKNVSRTQLYKQMGNSVVVPVVQRIAKNIIYALACKYSNKINIEDNKINAAAVNL